MLEHQEDKIYDVAIIGAGLAGLTLARQLSLRFPEQNILILHDSSFPNEEATHKVGESTVEIGAYYLATVLDLKDYLQKQHVIKMGLRFLQTKDDSYKELGITEFPWNECYQLDRGKLENHLYELAKETSDIYQGHRFLDFENHEDLKIIKTLTKENKEKFFRAKWVVDASGRKRCLTKKLGIAAKTPYPINHSSVWFRVDHLVDINDIYSEDVPGNIFWNKRRVHSTVHIMGEGYWVWLIPLVGPKTSVGIVFDEEVINGQNLLTQEQAYQFLKEKEPRLYQHLVKENYLVLDFKYYRKYSYIAQKFISEEHWALTGESYGFIDPLYSTGTDLIGFSNTFICNVMSFKDFDTQEHYEVYNEILNVLYEIFFLVHYDSYRHFKSWYYIFVKTNMDAIIYFATVCVLYMNNVTMRANSYLSDTKVGLSMARNILKVYKEFSDVIRSEEFLSTLAQKDLTTDRFIDINRSVQAYINRDICRPGMHEHEVIKDLIKNLDIFSEMTERLKAGEDYKDIFYDSDLYFKYFPNAYKIN